jgi:hypothetical protein|tara:strand:- start:26073 stop:26432 length:360 start_codon:yes stop_codon:yes gene_type:complete
MLNQRMAAAQKVADRLFSAEAALDSALAEVAQLTAAVPIARAEAGLSAMFGQDALQAAQAAVTALVDARGKLLETHRQLDNTKDQMGLRTKMFGGGMPKPEPLSAEQPRHLTVVTSDAA